jgi:hypothetical protein
MVAQIKEFNHAIIFKLELDLEQQPKLNFQFFTYLRTPTCTTPNKPHKLRQRLW